jgi:hypothetical protein
LEGAVSPAAASAAAGEEAGRVIILLRVNTMDDFVFNLRPPQGGLLLFVERAVIDKNILKVFVKNMSNIA